MDNFFVTALVRAGTCRRHAEKAAAFSPRPSRSPTLAQIWDWIGVRTKGQSRQYTANARKQAAVPRAGAGLTRAEMMTLVDTYDTRQDVDQDIGSHGRLEFLPESDNPAATPLVEDDMPVHTPWPVHDERDREAIERLTELLSNEHSSHDSIFEAYKALPQPRVSFLPLETIRCLLRHLAIVEYKTQSSMLRYLSVADDMKDAGLPMTSGEWSSAIQYVGRCFYKVSSENVRDALNKWIEMEREAGVKGTHITFNILFDIATKAGKFALAETIMKEMQARGLQLSRYFRVSLIYYFGIRANGNGIRKAYKELVEAGEAVDTVVMNCVIASLLKAGEATAADEVYERMKRMHFAKPGSRLPPSNWREVRKLGILLDRQARLAKAHPYLVEKLQHDSPVAPDLQTFKILIRHNSITMGNIDRVTELLDEMQDMGVGVHGSIFVYIFVGFSQYGGIRYTSWTRSRLEQVWRALLGALDSGEDGIFWSIAIARSCLQAFAKCAGRERTLEIWAAIQMRWQPDNEERESISRVLRDALMYK